jgi:cell division protein FtsX
MASRFWPGEDPVGRRISIGEPTSWVRVVGVVGDVSHDRIDAAPLPEVYLPFLQNPDSGLNVVVRATGGFSTLAGQIRRAVRAEDPDLPLVELRPMAERVQDALAEPRFLVQTLAFFGGSSLLLAALALFGLVTNDTVLRRREIGIRLALGGPRSRVAGLFVLRAMRLVAIGTAIGLAGVAILAPRLGPALHGTSPDDPRSLVAAAAVLVLAALVAVLVPVLRSLRSDPLQSLRSE